MQIQSLRIIEGIIVLWCRYFVCRNLEFEFGISGYFFPMNVLISYLKYASSDVKGVKNMFLCFWGLLRYKAAKVVQKNLINQFHISISMSSFWSWHFRSWPYSHHICAYYLNQPFVLGTSKETLLLSRNGQIIMFVPGLTVRIIPNNGCGRSPEQKSDPIKALKSFSLWSNKPRIV